MITASEEYSRYYSGGIPLISLRDQIKGYVRNLTVSGLLQSQSKKEKKTFKPSPKPENVLKAIEKTGITERTYEKYRSAFSDGDKTVKDLQKIFKQVTRVAVQIQISHFVDAGFVVLKGTSGREFVWGWVVTNTPERG